MVRGYFSKPGQEDGGLDPDSGGRKGNIQTDLSDSGGGIDLGL